MADGAGTILIIDDEEALRYILATWLQDAGFQVRQASNCQKARSLAGPDIDLVICDIVMPDGNGLELCQDLKSQRRGRSLPILLLSGYYTTAEDRASRP